MFTRGDFWTEMGFCEMIITELWLGPRRDAISAQSRMEEVFSLCYSNLRCLSLCFPQPQPTSSGNLQS